MSGSIDRVERLDARLERFAWDWADENDARIAAHWRARHARQPDLFDGRVLMVCGLAIAPAAATVTFFETSYARLLAHVDFGFPDPEVANGFAMGALRSRDGAYLLGVMAAHTANAGRLYFPAGTPDLSDVRPGGRVDLEGSMLREIGEETGLDAASLRPEPGWTIVRDGGRIAFMREIRLDLAGREAEDTIRRNLARQAKPELADIITLRTVAEIDESRMPSFLPVFLRDAFAGSDQLPG